MRDILIDAYAWSLWVKITMITPQMDGLTNTWAHILFGEFKLRILYYRDGFLFRMTIQESPIKIKP